MTENIDIFRWCALTKSMTNTLKFQMFCLFDEKKIEIC